MSEQIAANLTPEQRRVLLAMEPSIPADVWRLSWKLHTLCQLDAARVIAMGKRGWVDGRLTELGCQVREDLTHAVSA
ncbi:hypothetical protein ACFOMD_04095 [Sphingoaurantiacus capsulatus]|uniref:Uncharacterized protein n=1 Tax=Sphingoaurantiacus capsulatus TaxID=1771310 RepID=A0ABV7X7L8_9SPHN